MSFKDIPFPQKHLQSHKKKASTRNRGRCTHTHNDRRTPCAIHSFVVMLWETNIFANVIQIVIGIVTCSPEFSSCRLSIFPTLSSVHGHHSDIDKYVAPSHVEIQPWTEKSFATIHTLLYKTIQHKQNYIYIYIASALLFKNPLEKFQLVHLTSGFATTQRKIYNHIIHMSECVKI